MRLSRVTDGARVVLVRHVGDDKAVVLAEESRHPAADVLRETLAAGTDLAGEGTGERLDVAACRLLAPVANPSKVIGVGLNYVDHATESGMDVPPAPVAFAKTPNTVVGPDDEIRWSASVSTQVDYEAELAVVIGRRARRVSEADALDVVLGYTCCNDVSARDAQFADGQWTRGKSFDTFAPLGPSIVTVDEVGDGSRLAIRCRVGGVVLQDATTSDMIHGVRAIVSYLSHSMTLEPGDVIATGTPPGVGFARTPPIFLGDGDVVEVEVDRIGVLRNTVRVDA